MRRSIRGTDMRCTARGTRIPTWARPFSRTGKLVVSGSNNNGTDLDVILLRYHGDGTLDPEFGTAGMVIYDGGTGNDNGRRLAFQEGGKIVVLGNTHNGTDYDALVLRYDADGVPDEAFGNAGVANFNLGRGDDWGEAVAIQTDQNIVAVGGIGSTASEVLTMRIIGTPEGYLRKPFFRRHPDESGEEGGSVQPVGIKT